ncbi:MAG: 8-amino-7-oxononanoate synthase [Myxococcota bacterium]|nr:8-amino-7-oxononanoate synthase [Myxococcota bacterium]
MSTPPDFVLRRLEGIRSQGRFRSPPVLDGSGSVRRRVEGRDVLVFCSNDYLGLRNDPRVIRAAAAAVERWGAGSGSSRLIAGSLPIHRSLEEELAEWLGVEDALVCSSGYQANLALLQGLAGPEDRILSDALNHASLIDGCRLSRAASLVLPHGDVEALRLALAQPVEGESFVLGEGLYSMDGDQAPLEAWVAAAAETGAHVLVDEAHAVGVLGPEGRGACAKAGVADDVLARVGTFGKAFGSHGAFIATDAATRELLVNSGRTYIFTTGLPPAALGAARAALRIVRADEGVELRARLRVVAERFREGLAGLGLEVLGEAGLPILPVVVGEEAEAMTLYRALLDEGIYAMAIRPPTVPVGTCRLRFTVSAGHGAEMVDQALAALQRALNLTRG